MTQGGWAHRAAQAKKSEVEQTGVMPAVDEPAQKGASRRKRHVDSHPSGKRRRGAFNMGNLFAGSDGKDGNAPRPREKARPWLGAQQLSAITGVAVAVALASAGYGAWAASTSDAAVRQATAGAEKTIVTSRDIRAGDVVSAESLGVREIPAAYRCAAAVSPDDSGGSNGLVGRRALVDIPAGVQLQPSLLAGAADGESLSASLDKGMEAVSLSVDSETGVAGRVRPFDTVRVMAVEGASGGVADVATLSERALVEAVGDQNAAAGASYTTITVAVTPGEANEIRRAQYSGRVSVALASQLDAVGKGQNHG